MLFFGEKKIQKRKIIKPEKEKKSFKNPYFCKIEKGEQNINSWFFNADGWVYCGILILLFLGLIYFIFYTNYFLISHINISDLKKIKKDSVTRVLQDYVDTKKFNILPQKHWLFFDEAEAINYLKKKLNTDDAIESIKIEKKWPNIISVTLIERVPGLIWNSDNNKYYVDLQGRIVSKITTADNSKKYPEIVDQNKKIVNENDTVLTPKVISLINSIEKELPKLNINIKYYNLPIVTCQEQKYVLEKVVNEENASSNDQELNTQRSDILERYNNGLITVEQSLDELDNLTANVINMNAENHNLSDKFQLITKTTNKECNFIKINTDIEVMTDQNYYIIFNSEEDFTKQYTNLAEFIKDDTFSQQVIEYIDLRLIDRAYYK